MLRTFLLGGALLISNLIIGQNYQPDKILPQTIKKYGQGLQLESFIFQEKQKFFRLDSIINEKLTDTIFNLDQTRFFNFLHQYVAEQENLPLTTLSANSLAEFTVEYMNNLEKQRQLGDILYNHIKHKITHWLIPDANTDDVRKLLEGLELLGRGTTRLIVELNEIDEKALVNHMDDSRTRRILKALSKLQRRSNQLGKLQLTALGDSNWNVNNEQVQAIQKAFDQLMKPIDRRSLEDYHQHLVALVTFQKTYTELIGEIFESYLNGGYLSDGDLTIPNDVDLNKLKKRWEKVKNINKDNFNLGLTAQEALTWVQSDLKGDYFSLRKMFRSLDVIDDNKEITLLSKRKLRKSMDSIVGVWNQELLNANISLDTTRSSLSQLVKIGVKSSVNDLLSDQIDHLDQTYKTLLLTTLNWDQKKLDSLVISPSEKEQLNQLISKTKTHLAQVETILKNPNDAFGNFGERFQFKTVWNQTATQVRYELFEKESNDDNAISRLIPTKISTPWIPLPEELWKKELDQFENEWKNTTQSLELTATKEIQTFLQSHGFPGTVDFANGTVNIKGGIPFTWLGKKWKLEFAPSNVQDEIIRFGFDEMKNPDFWKRQIQRISSQEWDKAKEEQWVKIRSKIAPLLLDLKVQFPDTLESYLRGDTLFYSYDLGNLVTSLAGAKALFSFHKNQWKADVTRPPKVLLDHLKEMLPILDLSQVQYDSISNTHMGKVALKINETTIELGTGNIDSSGGIKISPDTNFIEKDIEISKDFIIKSVNVMADFNDNYSKIILDNVIFKNIKSNQKRLNELQGLTQIEIYIRPELKVTFGNKKKKELISVFEASLRSRGLLPPGVILKDITINSKGIQPKFELQEGVTGRMKRKAKEVLKELESIAIQVEKDPLYTQIGAQVESLKKTYDSWELNDKVEQLKLLQKVLSEKQGAQDLLGITTDEIKLSNGTIIKIDEKNDAIDELEITIAGFGCDNDNILSIKIEGDQYTADIEGCLKNYIQQYFNQSLINEDDLNIAFDRKKMRFTIKDFVSIPLEMYVHLDGSVSWNYSEEMVKKAILDPAIETAEEAVQKQLNELGLDVNRSTEELAVNILNKWETVFQSFGLQLTNKSELQNTLRSTQLADLFKVTLYAKAKGTTGLLEGVLISNIELRAKDVLTPNFDLATADLGPLTNRINNWMPNIIQLEQSLRFSRGIVEGKFKMTLPNVTRPMIIPFRVDVKKKTVDRIDWREIIFESVKTVLSQRMLPYSFDTDDASLTFDRVEGNLSQLVLALKGELAISTGDLTIPVPIYLKYDFKNNKIDFGAEKDLKKIFIGFADKILKAALLPAAGDDSWVKEVGFYPIGEIPNGIRVKGQIPLWDAVTLTIPSLLISNKGIRPEKNSGIGIEFKAITIPVPPAFKLSHFSGELNDRELSLSAKLSFIGAETERLIHAKGTFTIDLDNPLTLKTRTDLVALMVISLGYSESELILHEAYYRMKIDMGGPLKNIISIKGTGTIAGKEFRIQADGKIEIFREPIAKGKLDIDLKKGTIIAHQKIDIPVTGSVESTFRTERNFSNPTISAEENVKVWKFKLAGTRFLIGPSIASSRFSVMGMSMGLQVPGYKELDSDLFKKLLENLLSPDFENLDEALKALLSGNITLNPFTGFGPGGGSVGGDAGDGGGGGNNGVNGSSGESGFEGVANATSSTTGAQGSSAGSLQKTVSKTPITTSDPIKNKQGDGITPVAVPGTFSYPVFKESDNSFRAYKRNSEKPDENTPITFVVNPTQEEFKNHFENGTESGSFVSAGIMLGAASNFYAHILNQASNETSCGTNNAVIHWYTGQKKENVKHFSLPLEVLKPIFGDLCFNSLTSKLAGDRKLGYWLQGLSYAVASQSLNLNDKTLISSSYPLELSDNQYAVAVRFYNNLEHTLIIGTAEEFRVIEIPDLDLIKDNQSAKRSLLTLIQKHSKTFMGIYRIGNNETFLYTGCDPNFQAKFIYKLTSSGFTQENMSKEECKEGVTPPNPDPKPIPNPTPEPPPIIPSPPGNCSPTAIPKGNVAEITCPPNSVVARFPIKARGKNLFIPNGSSLRLNAPEIRFLKGLEGVFVTKTGGNESILWVHGLDTFTDTELKLGQNGLPNISQLFDSNNAELQSAILQFVDRTSIMLRNGHSLNPNSVKLMNNNNIVAVIAQYEQRPSSEYWVIVVNKKTKKSVTKRFVSGDFPIDQLPNFENHLISITQ